MKYYTLGFIFHSDLTRVLLIHKLTPEWQNGLVNWLGGKFEEWENCYQCASREIREESGLEISLSDWQKVAAMHTVDFHIDVLACIYRGQESDAKSLEEEQVEWFDVSDMPANIIGNLAWLVPMCLSTIRNEWIDKYEPGTRFYDIEFKAK